MSCIVIRIETILKLSEFTLQSTATLLLPYKQIALLNMIDNRQVELEM